MIDWAPFRTLGERKNSNLWWKFLLSWKSNLTLIQMESSLQNDLSNQDPDYFTSRVQIQPDRLYPRSFKRHIKLSSRIRFHWLSKQTTLYKSNPINFYLLISLRYYFCFTLSHTWLTYYSWWLCKDTQSISTHCLISNTICWYNSSHHVKSYESTESLTTRIPI